MFDGEKHRGKKEKIEQGRGTRNAGGEGECYSMRGSQGIYWN